MAIVKCQNPQCDYFGRAIPEGDFCPHCGYELNQSINTQESVTEDNFAEEERFESSPVRPNPTTYEPSKYEPSNNVLKLVHLDSGRNFEIAPSNATEKIYLGRQDGLPCDRNVVDITGIPFVERVSRLHAYITRESDRHITITDNDSTNGTILNGELLNPYQPRPLKNGDRLELGREHKVVFVIEVG